MYCGSLLCASHLFFFFLFGFSRLSLRDGDMVESGFMLMQWELRNGTGDQPRDAKLVVCLEKKSFEFFFFL